jgi:hypothetical protein
LVIRLLFCGAKQAIFCKVAPAVLPNPLLILQGDSYAL